MVTIYLHCYLHSYCDKPLLLIIVITIFFARHDKGRTTFAGFFFLLQLVSARSRAFAILSTGRINSPDKSYLNVQYIQHEDTRKSQRKKIIGFSSHKIS
jgi:hypothetical protein